MPPGEAYRLGDALVGGALAAPDDGACGCRSGGGLDAGLLCFLAFSHHFTEFGFEFSSSGVVHFFLLLSDSVGRRRRKIRGALSRKVRNA